MKVVPVTANDVRPAGPEGKCFYCSQPVGGTHALACVTVRRKVIIRVSFEYEDDFPQTWDAHSIEFNLNEGSRCADSSIKDIWAAIKKIRSGGGCLCGHLEHKYLREAEGDET